MNPAECVQIIKDAKPATELHGAVTWLIHMHAAMARRIDDLEQKIARLSLKAATTASSSGRGG